MIEFKDVSLFQGKKKILDKISFTCEKGRITTIIGKNGAGKTSALKCLTGENACEGTIFLNGHDIGSFTQTERAKHIAYLPQFLPDAPFTVYELAALGRRPYQRRIGKLTQKDRELIEKALAFTDMCAFSERYIGSLSGGEKQRAYLSMVLAKDSDTLVLDEPAAYMDAAVENEMCDLLCALSKEYGKTIVQVMHNLTRAVNHSDKIVILDKGRVIAQTDAERIKSTDLIEEIFSVKKGVFVSGDEKDQIVYL